MPSAASLTPNRRVVILDADLETQYSPRLIDTATALLDVTLMMLRCCPPISPCFNICRATISSSGSTLSVALYLSAENYCILRFKYSSTAIPTIFNSADFHVGTRMWPSSGGQRRGPCEKPPDRFATIANSLGVERDTNLTST